MSQQFEMETLPIVDCGNLSPSFATRHAQVEMLPGGWAMVSFGFEQTGPGGREMLLTDRVAMPLAAWADLMLALALGGEVFPKLAS